MTVSQHIIAVVEDLSIATQKLANFAVTAVKLATGAVTTEKIADGAVTNDKIGAGAVDLNVVSSALDLMTRQLPVRAPCRISTTANVTLVGAAPLTHDGVTLALGDRVLVRNQTDPTENGIYRVSVPGSGSNGTWVRDADADTSGDLFESIEVYVQEGTAGNNQVYRLSSPGILNIGVDDQQWDVAVVGSGVADGEVTNAKIRDAVGTSVIGRAANSTGIVDDIQAASNDTVLGRRADALTWAKIANAELRDSAGVSVLGRAANSVGSIADIAAGADNVLLGRRSGVLSFARVADAELRDSAGVSVLGRASGSAGVVADITAGADNTLLGRRSGALTYAKVALETEVTGILPVANGGSTSRIQPTFATSAVEWMEIVAVGSGTGGLAANTQYYHPHCEELAAAVYDAICWTVVTGAGTSLSGLALYSVGSNGNPDKLLWSITGIDTSSATGAGNKITLFSAGTWTADGAAYKNGSNQLSLTLGLNVYKAFLSNGAPSNRQIASSAMRSLGRGTNPASPGTPYVGFSEVVAYPNFPAVATPVSYANSLHVLALRRI